MNSSGDAAAHTQPEQVAFLEKKFKHTQTELTPSDNEPGHPEKNHESGEGEDSIDDTGMSPEMRKYFHRLEEQVKEAYDIANAARILGFDPAESVEIPLAKDLAARVESLVGPPGIAEKIRHMLRTMGNREAVAIQLAKELVHRNEKNTGTKGSPEENAEVEESPEERIEQAVRTCLAVLTEGVLVAPLEGISKVKIKKNPDGSPYVALYFAGPIRSAGGTGQALSVLIADVARRELGIGRHIATDREVERLKEEIPLYRRLQHLQYTPTNREIETIVRGCPISIDGEGTEKEEISGNRDIESFDTNRVRGGACLVISEGMSLKAKKIMKHVDRLGITGWEFLKVLTSSKKEDKVGIGPNYKYIKELIAGRPVFSHPSRKGGFRLRYGRGRTEGIAAIAIHPAAMIITEEFLAIGTQVKIERPGKAGAVSPCDTIEGPLVLLKNGDFIRVDTAEEASSLKGEIAKIVDLGEILIPFGEFAENNHVLMPGSFSVEWWEEWVRDRGIEPCRFERAKEAFEFMRENQVPLHPDYNVFWHDISVEEARELRDEIMKKGKYEDGVLRIRNSESVKRCLLSLGALHTMEKGKIVLTHYACPLIRCLGLDESLQKVSDPETDNIMDWVSENAGGTVKPRSPTRIGTRMGRPEKAKERTMKPAVNALYPIGEAGGNKRLVNTAAKKGTVEVEVGVRYCPNCGTETHRLRCYCGTRTVDRRKTARMKVDVSQELNHARKMLGLNNLPDIKGVKGMMSKRRFPEPLEKGLLRAKNQVYVYKDGTMRVDLTDMPLTHFRPREIGTSVEQLRELGYTHDIHGAPLESEDQLLELRVQDVIPSRAVADYLVRAATFVDEELEKIYGLGAYYNVRSSADLVGKLVIGLAPHTSAGVLGRIIGFTKATVCYAHPFFHTAKRRNCDGDEDALMLLMDGLLNFSREFIPDRLGGLMDAPLVLSTRINPAEIDKEAHNVDLLWRYPLEFYRKAEEFANPKDIEKIMDTVGGRVGTPGQYERFGFTHDTSDINEGPRISVYKTLGKMAEKMEAEFRLENKLMGVDVQDVAKRVIETHFLPDIIGNMNKFSRQGFRCTKCNTVYRRIPISGKCTKRDFDGNVCGGNLVLTVYEASVKKYLNYTRKLAEDYGLPLYTIQRIRLTEESVKSLFDSDRYHKATLDEFF